MKKILIALLTTASMSLGTFALAHDAKQTNDQGSAPHGMSEHAHGHEYGHGKKHGKKSHRSFIKHMTKQLDLSDEQVTAIKALNEQARSERPERSRNNNIMTLDPSAADYTSTVAAMASTKAADVEQSIIKRGALHAQVFALLTPEQQEKAKQLQLKHLEKKGHK